MPRVSDSPSFFNGALLEPFKYYGMFCRKTAVLKSAMNVEYFQKEMIPRR